MNKKEIDTVISYVRSLGIKINQEEFKYQVNSHPDSPSLLAYSDALTFLGIENIAFNISPNEIQNMPKTFLAVLKEPKNNLYISYVKLQNNKIHITNSQNKIVEISNQYLQEAWSGVVLIAEKNKSVITKKNNANFLSILITIMLLMAIYLNYSFDSLYYGVFIMLGIFFSIEAIKTELGFDSMISDQFCTSEYTDCEKIINSNKSIFAKLKLSDISIWFFLSQLLGLLLSNYNNLNSFYTIWFLVLCSSIPITFYSLYFQKKIEKKWCPICLCIITVLYIQLLYLLFSFSTFFNMRDITNHDIIIFIISLLMSGLICNYIKKILIKTKHLKEINLMGMKYIKNYIFFKRVLKGNKKIIFKNTILTIGNQQSKNTLTVITSPLCGYCGEMHKILHSIYEKYSEKIKIELRFNLAGVNDVKIENLYIQLYNIYYKTDNSFFLKALEDWYNNKEIDKWLEKYSFDINNKVELLNNIITISSENESLGLNFTPVLYINGYEYVNIDKNLLESFIPDLIEDEDF